MTIDLVLLVAAGLGMGGALVAAVTAAIAVRRGGSEGAGDCRPPEVPVPATVPVPVLPALPRRLRRRGYSQIHRQCLDYRRDNLRHLVCDECRPTLIGSGR